MTKLAANLVRSCLRITPDDHVTIFFYPHTQTLTEDIAEECFKIGADVNLSAYTDRFYESYMRLLSVESLKQPSVFCRALTGVSTAIFWLAGLYDPSVFRRVPPEKSAAAEEGENAAHFPLARDRKVRSLFVGMSQVTRPRAKTYGYSFPRWQKMMAAASAVPATKLSADGRRLASLLLTSEHVHITDGGGTDLEFSIRGRRPQISRSRPCSRTRTLSRGTLASSTITRAERSVTTRSVCGTHDFSVKVPAVAVAYCCERVDWQVTLIDAR